MLMEVESGCALTSSRKEAQSTTNSISSNSKLHDIIAKERAVEQPLL